MPLRAFSLDFLGAATEYVLKDGRRTRRHCLDSAASTFMMGIAFEVVRDFLHHYGSTHSTAHFSARIATEAMEWAHGRVLDFVGADPDEYVSIFHGSGATGCINRLAKTFAALRPGRPAVLVSLMEHHSNDLPHRRHAGRVEHVSLEGDTPALGVVSLAKLEEMLAASAGRVNYVAITAASNVTGIVNPIHAVAEIAHRHGAYVLVDGAQIVPHRRVTVSRGLDPSRRIDAFVFSGHKIYAPGSPGVIVVRKELVSAAEPAELGGGVVHEVLRGSYRLVDRFPDREQAGTPNVVGAVALASVLEVLTHVGFDRLMSREESLVAEAIAQLKMLPRIEIYGETDPRLAPRVGVVSFNVRGLDHGLVAAALSDYHNVAVRHGCFCAHPYARELLSRMLWELDVDGLSNAEADAYLNLKRGMVRASFGLYSTADDLDALIRGVADLVRSPDRYRARYVAEPDGTYRHVHAERHAVEFHPRDAVAAALARRLRDPLAPAGGAGNVAAVNGAKDGA